MRLGEHIG
ncbi:unnamed protein product [Lathyrus oleraceus]